MATKKISDINIYYEIRGQGEPLVLILGLAATVSEFKWLVDALATKYKVLAFDNRGAGQTDKPNIQYSIEMIADDTSGLMNALGFEKANVMGISLAGRIALELALKHRDMVKKLILVSTSARVIRTWRRYLVFNVARKFFRDSQPNYAFKRQSEASASYDATARLLEINIPTLILQGKSDGFARLSLAEELHSNIKDSKLITFKGGHLFFILGERAKFLAAVENFLS